MGALFGCRLANPASRLIATPMQVFAGTDLSLTATLRVGGYFVSIHDAPLDNLSLRCVPKGREVYMRLGQSYYHSVRLSIPTQSPLHRQVQRALYFYLVVGTRSRLILLLDGVGVKRNHS